MTTDAVTLGIKSPLTVVTSAAEFAGIDFVHGNGYSSLLHLREGILVVAFLAFNSGVGMNLPGEGDLTHAAFGEIKRFAGWYSQSECSAEQDKGGSQDKRSHWCSSLK